MKVGNFSAPKIPRKICRGTSKREPPKNPQIEGTKINFQITLASETASIMSIWPSRTIMTITRTWLRLKKKAKTETGNLTPKNIERPIQTIRVMTLKTRMDTRLELTEETK